MRRSFALLLALPWLSAVSAVADEPAGPDPALAAGTKVRASIPVPEEEKGLAFEFEGDLVLQGSRAGSVHFSVDTGEYKGQPVWLTSEKRVEDFAGAKTTVSSSYYLRRDLTLLRGEWERTTVDDKIHLDLVRTDAGVEVTRERTPTGGEPAALPSITVSAPPDAILGTPAVLLFLKYAPKDAAKYALPAVDLNAAVPRANEHEPAPDAAPWRVTVKGDAKYGEGPAAVDSWMADVYRSPFAAHFHLSPKDRSLLGVDGIVPVGERVARKGSAGEATEYADDKPADSWRAAFLKLGHGYHLAIPKLIEEAVKWQVFYDYEVGAGSWPKDQGIDDFKKAWVEEFLKKSHHRPRAEADALLRMTIATAVLETQADGTVVLKTHPEFGGNVFYMRQIDKVWWVVRMDQ